jgi:hypothetical protein
MYSGKDDLVTALATSNTFTWRVGFVGVAHLPRTRPGS